MAIAGIGIDVDWLKTNPGRKAYQSTDPQTFRDRGFEHLRLRVREYDLDTVNPDTGLSLLGEIVKVKRDCDAAGITSVVAFQGEDFKLNPTEEEIDRVRAWWVRVASAVKGPCNLIIETTDAVRNNDTALNLCHKTVYDAIQKIAPGRTCIVPPSGISSPERLSRLQIPGPYCFAEAHCWAAGWSKTIGNKIWTVGTTAERKAVTDMLDIMAAWSDATQLQCWFGAIMLGSDNAGEAENEEYSIEEQVELARFVIPEVRSRGIAIALNSDTRYYDRDNRVWIEAQRPVLDAVFEA